VRPRPHDEHLVELRSSASDHAANVTACARCRGHARVWVELHQLRTRGYSFERAWPTALAAAIEGQPDGTALFWATAWLDEQRAAWKAGYERRPVGRGLLVTLPDDDASTYAEPRGHGHHAVAA
jgi:hypothetical protein